MLCGRRAYLVKATAPARVPPTTLPGRGRPRPGAHIPVKERQEAGTHARRLTHWWPLVSRAWHEGSIAARRYSGPALVLLGVFVMLCYNVPTGGVPPAAVALPHESAYTLVRDMESTVPTPAGVPAGLTPINEYNHPCWPIDPNGSMCVQVDMENYTQPDVVPNAPDLNTTWQNYPTAAEDIHFQVLSVWNIGNCVTYNVPDIFGGSTACDTSTGVGPSEMYTGWDAYLYLSVIDVMWQDVCWFCDTDGTQWHANAGVNWAPQTGEPYYAGVPTWSGTTPPAGHPTNWVFDINISADGATGQQNFPNGTWVNWNVTAINWTAPGGIWEKNQYCAPQCGGNLHGGMFYYFTKNFWYYDAAVPPTNPQYGPNGANQALDPFSADLNLTYYPVIPNVGDSVIVDLRTQNVDNLSGGRINVAASIIILNAWYPNGTFWRSWTGAFTPLAYPYNETWHARVYLPEDFFAHSGTRIQWFIQAYDSFGHMVQSRNFTQITSTIGTCPNTNFTACLNLTTSPTAIAQEGWHGWLPTIPPSIPGVGINQEVNVTITTLNRSIDIEAAYVIIHVNYSLSGGSGTGLYTLHRITLNVYYFDIPALPEGSNVTFVVKAYDFNETSVISHPYRYFIPFSITPPAAYCFFYVQVYDDLTNQPVNGVNLTITGLAGTIRILTQTTINGVAYPNVTGQPWTPRFLPANVTYSIKATIPGFSGDNLPPPGNVITTSLYCTHVMNTTQLLTSGPNYQVELKYAVLNITLNQITSPPIFSEVVSPGIGVAVGAGMAAATAVLIPTYLYWRKQREIAEAEEKRVTL